MFQNLNLTYKINLVTIIIISLILLAIVFVIYNFTNDIVLGQINEKIEIMTSYQKKLLTQLINKKIEEIKEVPEDPIVLLYTDFAYHRKQKKSVEEYDEEFGIYTFDELISNTNLVYRTGKRLNKLISEINYGRIAYITDPDGIVIADSRYLDVNDYRFTGKRMKVEDFKKFSFANITVLDNEPLLLLNTAVEYQDDIIGYFVIGISTDIFRDNLDTKLGDYGSIILLNRKGFILNHNHKENIGKTIEDKWFFSQIKNGVNNIITTNENYKILEKMEKEELYFAINIPLSIINIPANSLKNIIFKIAGIGIIILIIFISVTIKWQLNPIKLLLNKMDKVSQGEMNSTIEINRTDEIGQLGKNFNNMIKEIKKLMREIKKDQELIRINEFKALQSQINPHFLYNSLDFIYWMTKAKKYSVIGKMVIALSNFYRLALNKGRDITTIKKEIDHIKTYLKIQELRHTNKFSYDINIDSSIHNYQCIKLILQPLVENAYLHGLKDIEEGGHIKITGRQYGDDILFVVNDNGCGFDVIEMEKTIEEESYDEESGYALKNVHNRIQIYYGKCYGLSFSSNKEGGACVTIKIPLIVQEKEEKSDEESSSGR